jgi:sortase A
VRKKRSKTGYTIEEYRRLLVEKHCAEHRKRIEHFRLTGRLFKFDQENHSPQPGDIRSELQFARPDASNRNTISGNRKRFLENLLLSIEIFAVLSLLFIVYSGVNMLRDFNQEIARAMTQPTLTTTPVISAVVLPSGHTPPNTPGGAQPNKAEIPENLRSLGNSLANVPVPTQAPQHATRIQIPVIGVDAPIVQGDGWEQLKKGVGQHIGSANPGEDSNLVLSAHNDIYGEIFRHLDQLSPGDQVVIFTHERSYTYLVSETHIVAANHIEVLAPTNRPIVTLISCYPYMINNKRIVVTAHLNAEGY